MAIHYGGEGNPLSTIITTLAGAAMAAGMLFAAPSPALAQAQATGEQKMQDEKTDPKLEAWAREHLYGTWRVQSSKAVRVTADGKRIPQDTELEGVLVFTPGHRVVAFVLHPGRQPAKTDADKARLLETMAAYTGRFELHPDRYIFTMDWSSTALNQGAKITRLFKVDGDRMVVTVPEAPSFFDPNERSSNDLFLVREK